MKIKVKVWKEIDVAVVRIKIPVDFGEEDIPNDFPLRKGDVWDAAVEIDTGRILDWPIGKSGNLDMKVCDGGTYTLFGSDGYVVAKIEQDYVPNGLIPGEYGDYIRLKINDQGVITNWDKHPRFNKFFEDVE